MYTIFIHPTNNVQKMHTASIQNVYLYFVRVTALKFALMDCYGHGILVEMCYAIARKHISGMKLTEFVQDIKMNVFIKVILKNIGCYGNRKAVLVKFES